MGWGNQRRMGAPFQMGSGRPGIVPRGGNRPMFQNTGAGSANAGPQLQAMLGGGGQMMPSPGGRPPSGMAGAVQGAMQGIGPGGLQADPQGQTVMGPGGPIQVGQGMYPNAPRLPPQDPTMRADRPGPQGPDPYQGMTGSEIFARFFAGPQGGPNDQLARAMGGRP